MPKKGNAGSGVGGNPELSVETDFSSGGPGDLALEFIEDEREADLVLAGADLKTDASIRTSILISLFTNARDERDERLHVDDPDRRGWWGDTYAEIEGDRIGSLLWLLQREKLTEALRARAVRSAEQALQWLIDDRVAAHVEVTAEIEKPDRLNMQVVVVRPDAQRVEFEKSFVWEGVASEL